MLHRILLVGLTMLWLPDRSLLAMVGGEGTAAEEPGHLTVGSRVRITSGMANEQVIGTVLGIDVDALILGSARNDTPARIPVADIVKLEVSRGQKSQVGRGAMIGAAVGLMPGLLMTTGDYSSDVHGDSHAATVAAIGAAGVR